MLPESWKQQIDESVKSAANTKAEDEEARIECRNAIAAPLNRLTDELVGYKQEQREAENSKKKREAATIWGIFITAIFALGQGFIFWCQKIKPCPNAKMAV